MMRECKKMTWVSLFSENENTCYVDIKPQDKIRSYDIRGQLWPALMAFHLCRGVFGVRKVFPVTSLAINSVRRRS